MEPKSNMARVSIEWLFRDIINYFKCRDFTKKVKIQISAVGDMYIVCTFLKMNGIVSMEAICKSILKLVHRT